jgi:hypothetical protein
MEENPNTTQLTLSEILNKLKNAYLHIVAGIVRGLLHSFSASLAQHKNQPNQMLLIRQIRKGLYDRLLFTAIRRTKHRKTTWVCLCLCFVFHRIPESRLVKQQAETLLIIYASPRSKFASEVYVKLGSIKPTNQRNPVPKKPSDLCPQLSFVWIYSEEQDQVTIIS